MTDHKFEPFEKVLVRDYGNHRWKADFFSHIAIEDDTTFFVCMGSGAWLQCIPYTPETTHLLGTSQPYEPPKPPQEYEWGQKVEVLRHGCWRKGVFVKNKHCTSQPIIVAIQGHDDTCHVAEKDIRPLPDDTAAN